MQYFRAISKTAGGTGNGGYPSPNGAPVPPPWLFPIWSNGGGGFLTVDPTYIAFDLTGNGIAKINVGTGANQLWSGNSITPVGTYLDPNAYQGPYDTALRAEAVSQNEQGIYVYAAGPLVPQIQQTVVRSGTCPTWNFPDGYKTPPLTVTFTPENGYQINYSNTPVTYNNVVLTYSVANNNWSNLTSSSGYMSMDCSNGIPIPNTPTSSTGVYYVTINGEAITFNAPGKGAVGNPVGYLGYENVNELPYVEQQIMQCYAWNSTLFPNVWSITGTVSIS